MLTDEDCRKLIKLALEALSSMAEQKHGLDAVSIQFSGYLVDLVCNCATNSEGRWIANDRLSAIGQDSDQLSSRWP